MFVEQNITAKALLNIDVKQFFFCIGEIIYVKKKQSFHRFSCQLSLALGLPSET